MNLRSFLNKANQIEIRIRKAINTQMHGNYASIFKGSGLEFNDLRQYQYGDDVRHIDWNASAKGHGTFIKLFTEEKEQTVFFLVDASASQQIGSSTNSKMDTIKEITAVLALSAIQEAGHIGLCCFTDKAEKFMAPAPGKKHGYKVISELFKFQAENTSTDLKAAFKFCLQMLKRKSIIICLSDFLDQDYEDILKATAQRHDLVLIQLQDKQELQLPRLGIIPIYNPETKKISWVNSSSKSFRNLLKEQFMENQEGLSNLCKKYQIDYSKIINGDDFVPDLVQLFSVRK